jgi:hypothetical protein
LCWPPLVFFVFIPLVLHSINAQSQCMLNPSPIEPQFAEQYNYGSNWNHLQTNAIAFNEFGTSDKFAATVNPLSQLILYIFEYFHLSIHRNHHS